MSSKSKFMSELQEKQEIDKLFELVNDPTFFIEMPQYGVKKKEILDILNRRKRQNKSLDIEKDGEPLLSLAILEAHPQIALEMVKLGANVNTKSKHGEPVIILANESLMSRLTRMLIEKNAKIDETVKGSDGYTLLHKPVHYLQHDEEDPTTFDKYYILRLLCEKLKSNKSAINAKDNDNKTPIMTIIDEYSNEVAFEACKILIEDGGADISINDGKKGKGKGNIALNFAIMKGNVDLSKYLIKKGADIEHYNDDDMTPLHLAVKYNLPEIVISIINKNPMTVLAKNNKDKTPKDLVITTGNNKTHSDIKQKFDEFEDNTGRSIHRAINKSYKRKSSKSPEGNFKFPKDSVLGNEDLIRKIMSHEKFEEQSGGKKKTYKKKCFICKKYNKLTLKKYLNQYNYFIENNKFRKTKKLNKKLKKMKYACEKCKN
jgi:hypothetical protein